MITCTIIGFDESTGTNTETSFEELLKLHLCTAWTIVCATVQNEIIGDGCPFVDEKSKLNSDHNEAISSFFRAL